MHSYASALRIGFERVKDTGIIKLSDILAIQAQIDGSRTGLRKLPGTNLKNEQTEEVIYTPPQHPDDILELMNNLIDFINTPDLCDWDPLTKMAVIHHQFESIHPFYDGNGRVGRVLNVLFLVHNTLLDMPILYLSRFINQHKHLYYQELQNVRNAHDASTPDNTQHDHWESWILFILQGVEETARHTCTLIHDISKQMLKIKHELRDALPKIYSQDLINSLFTHPYTKVEFLVTDLHIHRNTAVKYLNALVEVKILHKIKRGKENYYLNHQLFDLLLNTGTEKTGDL